MRVAAEEVEGAVMQRIKYLASDGDILQRLTEETNTRLLKRKPALERQRQGLLKKLAEVKGQASKLLDHWSSREDQAGDSFVKEKLNDLEHQRTELETGLLEADESLRQTQEQAVTVDAVKQALTRIDEVYEHLMPFEKRDLMRLVLKQVDVNERQITLQIYALGDEHLKLCQGVGSGELVRPRPNWLPGQDSNLEPSG